MCSFLYPGIETIAHHVAIVWLTVTIVLLHTFPQILASAKLDRNAASAPGSWSALCSGPSISDIYPHVKAAGGFLITLTNEHSFTTIRTCNPGDPTLTWNDVTATRVMPVVLEWRLGCDGMPVTGWTGVTTPLELDPLSATTVQLCDAMGAASFVAVTAPRLSEAVSRAWGRTGRVTTPPNKWAPMMSIDVRFCAHVAAPWYPDNHVIFATHVQLPSGFPAGKVVGTALSSLLNPPPLPPPADTLIGVD